MGKPFWFQLYVMKDRGFIRSLISVRPSQARCGALVLTVDLQVLGQRHCDIRNGMTVPPVVKLADVIDIASEPGWALSILRASARLRRYRRPRPRNGQRDLAGAVDQRQFDRALNWKDVEWVRSLWPGKLILKGVWMSRNGAKVAAQTGASALVVSNHGGRQLDGAPSSISALPKIADAVGSQIEVMFDGGIRSGQDVLRALALGARSCLIGRSYVYGLGAYGQEGVAKAIDILAKELDAVDGAHRHGYVRRLTEVSSRNSPIRVHGPSSINLSRKIRYLRIGLTFNQWQGISIRTKSETLAHSPIMIPPPMAASEQSRPLITDLRQKLSLVERDNRACRGMRGLRQARIWVIDAALGGGTACGTLRRGRGRSGDGDAFRSSLPSAATHVCSANPAALRMGALPVAPQRENGIHR